MLKATKVHIYPTNEQAEFLNQQFGAVRFIYNKGLHIISSQYKRHALSLNARRHIKPLLAVAKKSRKYEWLKQYDSIALQQACRNLNTAFSKFFDKKIPNRYPKFKRRHDKQSSYHCTSVSFGEDWIKIPKCQSIKARIHWSVKGKLKSITLSKTTTGKYYASLLIDDGSDLPSPLNDIVSSKVVGIDLGLTHLVIDSNGQKTDNPRFVKRAEKNLRRKQKQLSRKQKGSANRAKARMLVAKCHEKIANARKHFQHTLSKQLVDENQAIAVESLKIKNMLKNRKLSKHIADAAWCSLGTKIKYKAIAQGKHVVEIDTFYPSSKTCHACGHKVDKMPLNIRTWDCPSCGTTAIDRDINAALNIKQQGIVKLKAAGLTVSANGGLRQSATSAVAACEVGSLA